ncbi:MAG: hypothetical protein GF330_11715, partial [Candidatus Eisenbacteria bacterium]|nr:hypothetical protein [Candidatus Eisenbacteria bacterium]
MRGMRRRRSQAVRRSAGGPAAVQRAAGLALGVVLLLLSGSDASLAQRPAGRSRGSEIDLTMRQAQVLLRRGDAAAAAELLAPLAEKHPRDTRLTRMLVEAHLRNDAPRVAAARIEEALHQHRQRDLELWRLLARAYREAGDGAQAVDALLGALQERPAWTARLRDSFELLVADSLVGEAALAAFSRRAQAPDAPDPWREILAHLYVVRGRGAEALALVAALDRAQQARGRRLFV